MGISRVMSNQKAPKDVKQLIVMKILVGEKSHHLKFTTEFNNSIGKSVSSRPVCWCEVRRINYRLPRTSFAKPMNRLLGSGYAAI
ncbi:hypothetical protein AVEN_252592-1 [Araneus ventricosus]|uniref:Uncharacterized protein n=1 Tax=Araneus ventricosus TaxID=182803 RepID=A0A4Y2ARA1_ARAVE|nr:hypothetical protein AVEN_252592-1 [Araneus ventricosus]